MLNKNSIELSDYQYNKKRMGLILAELNKIYPDAQTELRYQNPFQLLVSVILSAQCTDERVNKVTPALFDTFPDSETMAAATPEIIYPYIRSISYPNSKAKNLAEMAKQLVQNHQGIIPNQVSELIKLPGVGRKTAHVICSVLFGMPTLAVDTHVFRISHRLGFSVGKTPEAVEKDLMRFINPEQVHQAHHLLILHGRRICIARKPKCDDCAIALYCPKIFE